MVFYILIFTSIISIWAFNRPEMMYRLDFQPALIQRNLGKEWFRFLSHGFVHADWPHLIFNMLTYFFFAPNVERVFEARFGEKATLYFLLLYLGGICLSVIPSYEKNKFNSMYHAVGASGGVSSILFASVIYFPMNNICLYGLICLPGIIWAGIYLVYSYYMGRKGGDNINHDAHIFGALYGVALTLILDPSAIKAMVSQIMN
jgi:membrane associated rhomboid family serine protease